MACIKNVHVTLLKLHTYSSVFSDMCVRVWIFVLKDTFNAYLQHCDTDIGIFIMLWVLTAHTPMQPTIPSPASGPESLVFGKL